VIFHVKKSIEAVGMIEKLAPSFLQSPNGKQHLKIHFSQLLCNLVRLSRGEMIGVKFNKDKDWVGGTIGLFER
jgi:hypothetical protein